MARSENQKLKLTYLEKMLREETDEEHGLTMPEIISGLEKYGVNADRKTVYADVEELRSYGLDIVTEKDGRRTVYKLASREFELPELKLLVDTVQSSKFITENKSRQLIKKLESLVSVHEAKQLHRQVLISGRIKTMNESIYYNVDKLHTAINGNKKIKFRYFNWNLSKQEEYRHDGAFYTVSPWHLRWDDENYYLIAYDDRSDKLKHYRVDKMKNIMLVDAPREGQKLIRSLDLTDYTKQLFGMFGGKAQRVELECENGLIGVMIDRFGKDIPVIKADGEHFKTYVNVAVSPQFLGWVASMCGGVKVLSPEGVAEDMKELSVKLFKQYE